MRRIKMIWDFRGPNAQEIAKHHSIHLQEFVKHEQIKQVDFNVETITDMYCTATMVVNETDVTYLRKALKPHRGQLFSE